MACGGEYSRQEVGDAAPCLWVKVQVRSVADADALGDGDHGGGGVGADVGGEGLQPLEGPVGRWGALHRAREHDAAARSRHVAGPFENVRMFFLPCNPARLAVGCWPFGRSRARARRA